MKLLLFAGAGTSIELGVPGMIGMGEEFTEHAKQWNVEPTLVERLLGESLDVELLIESLDRLCAARSPLELVGEHSSLMDRINSIRAEVEWFVQHVAERVVAADARLMWGSVLRAARVADLTLVTTNYDRAIELAANAEQVSIDDGFAAFGSAEASQWSGFASAGTRLKLIKLHGSTDWYAAGPQEVPTKLRHPMPLFGRATLRLADNTELGSALVLPSREKLLTHSPYPRLSQTFLNAADACDCAIFVGSSLRDHHIRGVAETTAMRVPVILVNPTGDTFGLENVTVINQPASRFLIGTLPNALRERDSIATLRAAATACGYSDGILSEARQALDAEEGIAVRCKALTLLDERGVTFDEHLLRSLLSDQSSTVARHALGLISMSPDCSSLLACADATPHATEAAFQEDLGILRTILASKAGSDRGLGADPI